MDYYGAVQLKAKPQVPEFEVSRSGHVRLQLQIGPEPFQMPGGLVEWKNLRHGNASGQMHQHFFESSYTFKELEDFTKLTVGAIRAQVEAGNSVGFTIGLLTSVGSKWLNWAMLSANTMLLQAAHDMPIFSTTSLSIPVELRFSPPRYGDEAFGVHHDHEVSALGGATLNPYTYEVTLGPRPASPGYLFVTKKSFISYGARREIEMAVKVNALAQQAGEEHPRIIMQDVRHSLKQVQTMDDMRAVVIFNAHTIGELGRIAAELVMAKDEHPEHREIIVKGLMELGDNLHLVSRLVDPLAQTLRDMDPQKRHELIAEIPFITTVTEDKFSLPVAVEGLRRGIEMAIA